MLNVASYRPNPVLAPSFKGLDSARQHCAVNKSSTCPKQDLPLDLYCVRSKGYKLNLDWGLEMNELTNKLTDMVYEKKPFNSIAKTAADGVYFMNQKYSDIFGYGVKKPYGTKSGFNITSGDRGEEYQGRYFKKFFKDAAYLEYPDEVKIESNDEYKKANTCTIERGSFDEKSGIYDSYVRYGKRTLTRTNLDLCKKEYNKLISKNKPSLDEILKSTATIHWLIAQETPWCRGSDSIANVITKSILQAYNVEISPIIEGHGFDFEAFCTSLDDYIDIYPSLFEKEPRFLNHFSEII